MDFVGTGKRLLATDFKREAERLGVEVAKLKAVVEVEAASYGFDDKKRPRILFEPHIFYRQLSGDSTKLAQAVNQGLAYKKWGAKPYPRTSDARYEQLAKAALIDETAALNSASWGLGQVMGFNSRVAGYASVQAMVRAMLEGEGQQLHAMANFIKSNGLDAAMRKGGSAADSWRDFAKGYNGAGYARNNYHTKLAAAFRKHSNAAGGSMIGTDPIDQPLVKQGSSGDAVKLAQERLKLYGFYDGTVDGRFGPATRRAVEAFQEAHAAAGMVDGIVGKGTWAVLLTDPAERDPESAIAPPANSDHQIPGISVTPPAEAVAGGGAGAAAGAAAVAAGLDWWWIAIIVVGFAIAGYFLWKYRKGN